MTEIPEAVSFIGTSLVYSENNIAESCVNVDNCDCFCRIRFPVAYFHSVADTDQLGREGCDTN